MPKRVQMGFAPSVVIDKNKTDVPKVPEIPRSKEELDYRSQLIALYKDQVAETDINTADTKKLGEIVSLRERYAVQLFLIGNERESHSVRKETIKSLLSRSERAEKALFDTYDDIDAKAALTNDILTKYEGLKKEVANFGKTMEDLADKLIKARDAGQDVDSLTKEIAAENANNSKIKEDIKDLEMKYNVLESEIKEKMAKSDSLNLDAINCKRIAGKIMIIINNSSGAMELAQKTIDLYHQKNIYGGTTSGEALLIEMLNFNEKFASQLFSEGKVDEAHILLQLGLENALDAATKLEQEIFSGKAPRTELSNSLNFRKAAANYAFANAEFDDMHVIIKESAELYQKNGHPHGAEEILELGANLSSQKSIQDVFSSLARKDEPEEQITGKEDYRPGTYL